VPGQRVGRAPELLLRFNEVRVGEDAVIGGVGAGDELQRASFVEERIGIAARGAGGRCGGCSRRRRRGRCTRGEAAVGFGEIYVQTGYDPTPAPPAGT
jgi:hypothetical protein